MDGEMQDTHKCKERAKMAADIIAEKYGWTKAEDRENKRMERIHDAAMKVLKRMDAWDIETYFAGMRRNGFEVEPTYDSRGVCRGYSIGEKLYDLDGNYSSTVMYKASAKGFGHGRDLTVSKLYGTWQKLHPEKEARTESYRWQQNRQEEMIPQKPMRSTQSDDNDAYLRLLRIKEAAERKNAEKPAAQTPVKQTEPAPRKSTEAESDRRTAIWLALNAIKRFVKSPFRTEFFAEQSDHRSSVVRLIGRTSCQKAS